MLKKKAMMTEILGVVIFMIVFLAASGAIAGVVKWAIGSQSPGDTSTIESFNNLVDQVEKLTQNGNNVGYKRNIPFYGSSDTFMASFESESTSFFTRAGTGTRINKPQEPECLNKCICIFRYEDQESTSSYKPLKCRKLDDNIKVYGWSDSFLESFSGFSNVKLISRNDINLSKVGFPSAIPDFTIPNWDGTQSIGSLYIEYTWFVYKPFRTSNFYIDYIDLSKFKNINDDSLLVFIEPMYGNGNTLLDDRENILSNLMSKSSTAYAEKITIAVRDYNALSAFFEYYQWADNDLLFDDTKLDDKIMELGIPAIERIRKAVNNRLIQCEGLREVYLRPACKEKYLDTCEQDFVGDVDECTGMMIDVDEKLQSEKLIIYLNSLLDEMDGPGKEDRLISDAQTLERNDLYGEAYFAYIDVLDEYYTVASDNIVYDYDKIAENYKLTSLIPALKIKELNQSIDIEAKSFGVDDFLCFMSYNNSNNYTYIQTAWAFAKVNKGDLDDFSSTDDVLTSSNNIISVEEAQLGTTSKDNIYLGWQLWIDYQNNYDACNNFPEETTEAETDTSVVEGDSQSEVLQE